MSCPRDSRPKTENCCSDTEQANSDDTGFFLQILRRVSELSSTIIRYLNEIRTDILKLFRRIPCANRNEFKVDQDMSDLTAVHRTSKNGRPKLTAQKRRKGFFKTQKNARQDSDVCGIDNSDEADRTRVIDSSVNSNQRNDAITFDISRARNDGSSMDSHQTNDAHSCDISPARNVESSMNSHPTNDAHTFDISPARNDGSVMDSHQTNDAHSCDISPAKNVGSCMDSHQTNDANTCDVSSARNDGSSMDSQQTNDANTCDASPARNYGSSMVSQQTNDAHSCDESPARNDGSSKDSSQTNDSNTCDVSPARNDGFSMDSQRTNYANTCDVSPARNDGSSMDSRQTNDAHSCEISLARNDGCVEAHTVSAFEPDCPGLKTQTQDTKPIPQKCMPDEDKQADKLQRGYKKGRLLAEFFKQLGVIFLHRDTGEHCLKLVLKWIKIYIREHGDITDEHTKEWLFNQMRKQLNDELIRYRSEGLIKDVGNHGDGKGTESSREPPASWKPNRAFEARRKHFKDRTRVTDANRPKYAKRDNRRTKSSRSLSADAKINILAVDDKSTEVAKTIKVETDVEMAEPARDVVGKQRQTASSDAAARRKVPSPESDDSGVSLDKKRSPRPEEKTPRVPSYPPKPASSKSKHRATESQPAPSYLEPTCSNPDRASLGSKQRPSNTDQAPTDSSPAPSGQEPAHPGQETAPSNSAASVLNAESDQSESGSTQGAHEMPDADPQDSPDLSALVPHSAIEHGGFFLVDPRALLINRQRVTRMIQILTEFCLKAYRNKWWEYHMTLVAKTNIRSRDGRNDWTPFYNDFLYQPNHNNGHATAIETRIAMFERRISIDPDMEFIGADPSAERLCEVLRAIIVKTTLTDVRRHYPRALLTSGQVDELRWCTDLLDVMTYITYYVMIGPGKYLMRDTDRVNDSAVRLKVDALRDHVVRAFEQTISVITPHMLHAIDSFELQDVENYVRPRTPYDVTGTYRTQVIQVSRTSPVQTCSCESAPPQRMPPENAPAAPKPTPPKQAKKKGRATRRCKLNRSCPGPQAKSAASAAGGDSDVGDKDEIKEEEIIQKNSSLVEETVKGSDVTEIEGKVTDEVIEYTPVQKIETVDDDLECSKNAERCIDDGQNDDVEPDVNDVTPRDYSDYVTYIETNNTLDYSALEVVAGHGETPNKKKLEGGIKEKKKTKGVPNKHLEPKPTHELYLIPDDDSDDAAQTGPDPNAEMISPEADKADAAEAQSGCTEDKGDNPAVLELVLDDRAYNLVPEEVIRKDESRLGDLEQAYMVNSAEKKKDKHKKKKERKSKGVRLQLDFEIADSSRFN